MNKTSEKEFDRNLLMHFVSSCVTFRVYQLRREAGWDADTEVLDGYADYGLRHAEVGLDMLIQRGITTPEEIIKEIGKAFDRLNEQVEEATGVARQMNEAAETASAEIEEMLEEEGVYDAAPIGVTVH